MRYREHVRAIAFATVLLVTSRIEAQEHSSAPSEIRITSCVVYSTKSPDTKYDCKMQAAKACNGKTDVCEIQIGYNLTAGKDIEPGSGFLGKLVKLNYVCGEVSSQRGPYQQSDHATLILDCGVP